MKKFSVLLPLSSLAFALGPSPLSADGKCIPVPQEYEIVHEVTNGDFRSSGEYATYLSCERDRSKNFSGINATCLKFLDARMKISPEEKSRWERIKFRGGKCW